MAEIESPDAAADLLISTAMDPVLSDIELPLRGVFHPRGYTLEITTNSPDVIAGAQESWGQYRREFPETAIQFRVGVLGAGNGVPPMPTCRAWRHMMVSVADAENFAVCDLRKGAAFGWFTQAAAANRAYLRYNFLEATALTLLNQMYLVPLHAACVQMNGRGVLLCGDSGAGKSSLAYACARRGWTFVADDTCALIRNRADMTVVGNPHQIRFREVGTELFPELRRQRITTRATGDLAIELATATVPEISTALTSSVDYVVFLNRRDADPQTVVMFPSDRALAWFEQVICFGEKEVRRVQTESLRKLLTGQVLELRYRDLDWAVNRLESLVQEGG
jgi:hypothetical protein